MGADLDEILRRLPNLAPADLAKVALRIDFLRGAAPGKNKSAEYDWLLEGFLVELRKRGLWAGNAVPKKLMSPHYVEKAGEVKAFLLEGLNRVKLNSAEHLSLGALAGRVLAAYLSKAKINVTLKVLLLNVDKVPLALEAAFPGYWSAKLLAFCLSNQQERS